MKRLPPIKRNQLIGVVLGTLGLISLVYFLLISPQNDKNRALANSIGSETVRLQQMKDTIKQMQATASALADLTQQLNHAEEDVASGDLYAWTYDTIRRYKTNYHVDIPTTGQPSLPADCDLIANFPYKQIRFTLAGTAYYHDLGKFISDFENKFPHCRVLNVSADPAANGPNGGEKLNFKMDIVALVKPTS
jgi:Tfp pilus assembly protein PilO